MSATVNNVSRPTTTKLGHDSVRTTPSSDRKPSNQNYKGFLAGVFSGIAKLSVGHPFDTIKVRLQTTQKSQFRGPLECLLQTLRNEGVSGLYKGATPPLVGWMFMDSVMLGSLTFYRRLLRENLFHPSVISASPSAFPTLLPRADANLHDKNPPLPTIGHGLAGIMAGWTVSFIAAPVEHIKARLQIQYASDKSKRLYRGPIDCARRIYTAHGIPGIYHGLTATLLFRSFFFFWWSSYDLFTTTLTQHTTLSTPAVNFWAGGLSAQVFWVTSYSSDVIKQRIMTDGLGKEDRRFQRWRDAARAVVWTTLITNTKYLSGLLSLDHSLKKHHSGYPLVALYTDTFPQEGHHALDIRNIPKKHVHYLLPSVTKDFSNDPRFYDCWSKLTPFSLTEFERVVQLDSDMLVLRNMDELMELDLDPPSEEGKGKRVFAAAHACVCNPNKKPHYPPEWKPENCAYTSQHPTPDVAQTTGASPTAGLAMCNGGLQVVNPSAKIYNLIVAHMNDPSVVENLDFADQSLLSRLFNSRWVPLPYIYNALKTMRRKGVHDAIWRDDEIKCIHYLLNPKPWDETKGKASEACHEWWLEVNEVRLREEQAKGIVDGF
ncbi:MAG: hypothetical protein M1817_005972 [Caeruleum heppii]|nr:MAG: hypothetical protein M1817_005972 [Caeruleum heppii]